jgi:hypothetical protein
VRGSIIMRLCLSFWRGARPRPTTPEGRRRWGAFAVGARAAGPKVCEY